VIQVSLYPPASSVGYASSALPAPLPDRGLEKVSNNERLALQSGRVGSDKGLSPSTGILGGLCLSSDAERGHAHFARDVASSLYYRGTSLIRPPPP